MFLVLTFQSILRSKFDIFYNGISVPLILNQSMLLPHYDYILKKKWVIPKCSPGPEYHKCGKLSKKESPENNFWSCRKLIKHKNCIILQQQNVTFFKQWLMLNIIHIHVQYPFNYNIDWNVDLIYCKNVIIYVRLLFGFLLNRNIFHISIMLKNLN